MEKFTYESQGTETLLIYHLGQEEHLDSFAKNMLQSNELNGILRPSFTQRDMEQYLRYPVTSKIQLKEFQQGAVEKTQMLKICLSIAQAAQEIEEYMLSPEKLMLDPEYMFVDIRKKEVSLLYLPIDEFKQNVTAKEFLLQLLSHSQYQLDGDVSYVAKLIHFLNQSKSWQFEELQRFIQNLLQDDGFSRNEKTEEEKIMRQEPHIEMLSEQQNRVSMPEAPILPVSPVVEAVPPVMMEAPPIPEKKKGLFGSKKEKEPKAEKKEDKKEKKGLFGGKKEKEKAAQAMPTMNMPNMAIPGMPISVEKQPVTMEVVLNVDESGKYVAPQEEVKKKGGLFGFGKKKKEKEKPAVSPMGIPAAPAFVPEAPAPAPAQRTPAAPVPSQMPEFQRQTPHPAMQMSRPAAEGNTVYMGHGNSDDNNRTVIMGGGKDYGATMILGNSEPERSAVMQRVVRITRRRTGQGMIIAKDQFRIGSEGSFVDFFIGDNPGIGSCHADIFEDQGMYYIMDRNSVNHTFVNGIQVQPMQAVQLSNQDIITLADEDFDFIIS